MSSPRLLATATALLLLVLAFALNTRHRDPEAAPRVTERHVDNALATLDSETASAEFPEARAGRSEVSNSAEHILATAGDRDLTGIVVDHVGRGVPNVKVSVFGWAGKGPAPVTDEDSVSFMEFNSWAAGATNDMAIPEWNVYTDEAGHFRIEDIRQSYAFEVVYYFPGFPVEGMFRLRVEPEDAYVELHFPNPSSFGTWVHWKVMDRRGVELDIDIAHLRPLERGLPFTYDQDPEIRVSKGSIHAHLMPGTWQLFTAARNGDGRSKRVSVDVTVGSRTIFLETLPGTSTERFRGSAEVPLSPTLSRTLKDRDEGTSYARTLRFGSQPVRAASLALEIKRGESRPDHCMLRLSAENVPSKAVVKLALFSDYEFETIHLDLRRLSGNKNLLPLLAEGELDILIEGDVEVREPTLRLVR